MPLRPGDVPDEEHKGGNHGPGDGGIIEGACCNRESVGHDCHATDEGQVGHCQDIHNPAGWSQMDGSPDKLLPWCESFEKYRDDVSSAAGCKHNELLHTAKDLTARLHKVST